MQKGTAGKIFHSTKVKLLFSILPSIPPRLNISDFVTANCPAENVIRCVLQASIHM